jgi:hypothetical protein
VKGIAPDSVEAANAADVTVENYGAVPPIDAHEAVKLSLSMRNAGHVDVKK